MKKMQAGLLVLIFLLPAAAAAETSGWIGGFSLCSEGFISETLYSDAEYAGINLYVEPWSFPFLTPSLSAGVLVAAAPFDLQQGFLSAELDLELFDMKKHPFRRLIDLDNSYCPSAGVRMLMPFSNLRLDESYVAVTVSPFRLKTGSGRFSILALSYFTESDLSFAGWGLRLFDIRLFIL